MPIHTYTCRSCGRRHVDQLKHPTRCESCASTDEMDREFPLDRPAASHLKGQGFYNTDYRSSPGTKDATP